MATATTTKAARTRTSRPAAPTTFRLLLALGGTAYWVRPITSALHAKAFRLRRADGRGEHHVTQDEHGHHCDCGDFTWRHEGRRPAQRGRPRHGGRGSGATDGDHAGPGDARPMPRVFERRGPCPTGAIGRRCGACEMGGELRRSKVFPALLPRRLTGSAAAIAGAEAHLTPKPPARARMTERLGRRSVESAGGPGSRPSPATTPGNSLYGIGPGAVEPTETIPPALPPGKAVGPRWTGEVSGGRPDQ